jgi:palmitoyltransferase ZDHHC2/15/20
MLDVLKWFNVFQFCKCLKLLGHVMVLLVVGIIGVSYYTIVIDCYGPYIIQSPTHRAVGSLLAVLLFTFLVGAIKQQSCIITSNPMA